MKFQPFSRNFFKFSLKRNLSTTTQESINETKKKSKWKFMKNFFKIRAEDLCYDPVLLNKLRVNIIDILLDILCVRKIYRNIK